MNLSLSPHFTLEEFCASQTAARMGRAIEPTDADLANLTRLCFTVLEPLRASLGAPIRISSGLRPFWLNEAIGGSKTSAHMEGRAADIIVPGMSPAEVCRRMGTLDLPFDQVILEFPDSAGSGWTHIGIAHEGSEPRRQYLTARVLNGRTNYEIGINP
jgi:hypothetical protein